MTIAGPCYLNVEVCDYKFCHPFYAIEGVKTITPIVVEYDFIEAAKLVINPAKRCVSSEWTTPTPGNWTWTTPDQQSSRQTKIEHITSKSKHDSDTSDVVAAHKSTAFSTVSDVSAAAAGFDVSDSSRARDRVKRDVRAPRRTRLTL